MRELRQHAERIGSELSSAQARLREREVAVAEAQRRSATSLQAAQDAEAALERERCAATPAPHSLPTRSVTLCGHFQSYSLRTVRPPLTEKQIHTCFCYKDKATRVGGWGAVSCPCLFRRRSHPLGLGRSTLAATDACPLMQSHRNYENVLLPSLWPATRRASASTVHGCLGSLVSWNASVHVLKSWAGDSGGPQHAASTSGHWSRVCRQEVQAECSQMRNTAAAAVADAERREQSVADAEERAARHEQVRSGSFTVCARSPAVNVGCQIGHLAAAPVDGMGAGSRVWVGCGRGGTVARSVYGCEHSAAILHL